MAHSMIPDRNPRIWRVWVRDHEIRLVTMTEPAPEPKYVTRRLRAAPGLRGGAGPAGGGAPARPGRGARAEWARPRRGWTGAAARSRRGTGAGRVSSAGRTPPRAS